MSLRPLIIGNWKMFGDPALLQSYVRTFSRLRTEHPLNVDVILCLPYTLLGLISNYRDSTIFFGAQDCHYGTEENGAFTGDISALMLKKLGCHYVIVGHSERRLYHGETSSLIGQKIVASLQAGLTPLFCVGETLEQRAHDPYAAIEQQLKDSLPSTFARENIIIAYEPVWAIGSGKTPTIQEVKEMKDFIKEWVAKNFNITTESFANSIRVVYGGSVKADNAASFLRDATMDGLLVGGHSTKIETFWSLLDQISG